MAADNRPRYSMDRIIQNECDRVLNYCDYRYLTEEGYNNCIDRQKKIIKKRYAHFSDVNAIVDGYKWPEYPYPAKGGKRKRRTMHRKRFHKKNSSRRNRRVR